jgi:hypothetical protein
MRLLFVTILMILAATVSAGYRAARFDTRTRRIQSASSHPLNLLFTGGHQDSNTRARRRIPRVPGWLKDAKVGHDEPTRCKKEDIIHECVVNFSWGLVGCF